MQKTLVLNGRFFVDDYTNVFTGKLVLFKENMVRLY